MPEYLAPGVYVEEIPSGAKPIEGVSTSTAGLLGLDMVAALRQAAEAEGRPWNKAGARDPGIALLELFAWLTERLAARGGQLPASGLPHAARLAAAALALVADRKLPSSSVLQQTRFFPGQRLDGKGRVTSTSTPPPKVARRSREQD